MDRKLVISSVGAFAGGALISWAITADLMEAKARRNRAGFRRIIENQQRAIWAMQDGHSMREVLDGSVSVEGQPELPDDDQALADLAEDNVIRAARIHSVSLDPTPNAFGESIQIVTPIDETIEGQEAQAALEDDEVDEEEYEAQRANLQKVIDQYTASPESRDEFVAIVKKLPAERREPPFVISRALYAWDEDEGNEYEKTTITFYARERILVDEDDEGIDPTEVDEYVGWKNLNRFGDESEDPDVVFVRNRRLKTDFEVVRSEEEPPAHVKYGMGKEEYKIGKAAGLIKFKEE